MYTVIADVMTARKEVRMTQEDDIHKGGVVFTQEQQDAIAALASTNKYAKQSPWQTLRELPPKDRLPFFFQNFLWQTVAIAVAVAMVIAIGITIATRDPEAELTVVRLNDSDAYAQTMDALKAGFVKDEKIEDERIMRFSDSFKLDESANIYTDDSASMLTRISAGDINVIITNKDTLSLIDKRGYASSPAEKLESSQMRDVSDALVDGKGEPVDNAKSAMALDLSRSATWTGLGGDSDAYLVISNVEDETHLKRMREFVDYLQFQ